MASVDRQPVAKIVDVLSASQHGRPAPLNHLRGQECYSYTFGGCPIFRGGQQKAQRRPSIATAATDLLVVAVKRFGETGVNNGANILLVHPDTKSGGGDHKVDFVVFPAAQNLPSLAPIGIAVEDLQTLKIQTTKVCCKSLRVGFFSNI